ncbi:MAG: DUF2891 domain-containing protein [Bacteroidetes bacterium]|nr:MAG: DUF2891 domain-containing protein [Bacteroidota bacterium]
MRTSIFLYISCFILLSLSACRENKDSQKDTQLHQQEKALELNQKEALRLAQLPCNCLRQEYPNKLNQVLGNEQQLLSPKELHPIFYGCFDWHSSVHGHWMLVALLKRYPELDKELNLTELLDAQFIPTKVLAEMDYFNQKFNTSFERTYGWAWLLKLQEELISWEDPRGKRWSEALAPLCQLIEQRYLEFLPKLNYPIRSGEHTNTAFGLSFALDYAHTTEHQELKNLIQETALRFYQKDQNYPLQLEPSGYDFLSPALQEVNLMQKVLPKADFDSWLQAFLPNLTQKDFQWSPGKVSDRSDGKLVHLDGLNFSRSWCLFELSSSDKKYEHLRKNAKEHLNHSLPQITDGDYMGEHWLASFALYALLTKSKS